MTGTHSDQVLNGGSLAAGEALLSFQGQHAPVGALLTNKHHRQGDFTGYKQYTEGYKPERHHHNTKENYKIISDNINNKNSIINKNINNKISLQRIASKCPISTFINTNANCLHTGSVSKPLTVHNSNIINTGVYSDTSVINSGSTIQKGCVNDIIHSVGPDYNRHRDGNNNSRGRHVNNTEGGKLIHNSQQRSVRGRSMAAVPTSGAAAAAQVSAVPMQPGMQLMNMRAQGNIMQQQQVRSISPRMILSSQVLQNVRAGQPTVMPGSPGHLLLKTENGQMHLVRVNPTPQAAGGQQQATGTVTVAGAVNSAALPATSAHVTLNQVATSNNLVQAHPYRFQQSQVSLVSSSNPVVSTGGPSFVTAAPPGLSNSTYTTHNTINNINSNSNNIIVNNNPVAAPPSAQTTIITNSTHNNISTSSTNNNNNIITSVPNTVLPSSVVVVGNHVQQQQQQVNITQQQQQQQPLLVNQQQQMSSQTISAESAKNKCKNFLATLLKLAGEQKASVAKNVRNLIQGLIDGRVEPEAFTEELQKDLNSSPQPCLVPFLKKTLPYLRASLSRGEIVIEGVEAPKNFTTVNSAVNTTIIPSMMRAAVQPSLRAANGEAIMRVLSVNNAGAGGSVRFVSPGAAGNTAAAASSLCRSVTLTQRPVVQQQQQHGSNTTPPPVTLTNIPATRTKATTTVLRPPLPQQQQQQIRVPNRTVVSNSSVGVVRIPNNIMVQQTNTTAVAPPVVTAAGPVVSSNLPQQQHSAPVVNSVIQQQQGTTTVVQQHHVTAATTVAAAPATAAAPVSTVPQQQQSGSSTSSVSSKGATVVNNVNKVNNNTKERVKEKQTYAYNNVADDDINDVAAMGGVNLGEESQRILDSTGFVGTQIRSCKDETFLLTQPLQTRLKQLCAKYDIEEPGKEFIALLSHGVQERLKTVVEKLSIITEHRLDLVKNESRYEPVQDVRGQLRFLEDLDRLEKKRKDEAEREMLLRAAKSRNKNEDPEQAKLKAKAKEMQRMEMEEMRQRDANMAALKALQGPKKKPKMESQTPDEVGTYSGTFSQKQMPLRQRTKRVNIRDLTFLMEQDKDMNKSSLLYRTYLK